MALVFPREPSIGDQYAGYVWDGVKWTCIPVEPHGVPLFSATTDGIVPKTGSAPGTDVLLANGTWAPVGAVTSLDDGIY